MQPLSLSLWAALSAWVAIFGTRELLQQPATVFHKLYQDVEAVELPACAVSVAPCVCECAVVVPGGPFGTLSLELGIAFSFGGLFSAFVLGCACGSIRRAPRRAVRLGSSAPALLPPAGKGVLGRPSYSST